MNQHEPVAASDANYFESWRMFAERCGLLSEQDAILITAPSPSLAWMNIVFVTRPLHAPRVHLSRAFAALDEQKLPFFVHMRSGLDGAAERACQQLGLVAEHPVPGMALVPITNRTLDDTPLDIRLAQDAATFADFALVVGESFGIPAAEASAMFPPAARARTNTHFWVGYAEGRPVTCSCLLIIGDVAGINIIGTVESHRGRGFGEAMAWTAVHHGVESGCRLAVLQASELGKPVYERMGFRTVCEYKTYIRPLRPAD